MYKSASYLCIPDKYTCVLTVATPLPTQTHLKADSKSKSKSKCKVTAQKSPNHLNLFKYNANYIKNPFPRVFPIPLMLVNLASNKFSRTV